MVYKCGDIGNIFGDTLETWWELLENPMGTHWEHTKTPLSPKTQKKKTRPSWMLSWYENYKEGWQNKSFKLSPKHETKEAKQKHKD
jgi:hypothetical protein